MTETPPPADHVAWAPDRYNMTTEARAYASVYWVVRRWLDAHRAHLNQELRGATANAVATDYGKIGAHDMLTAEHLDRFVALTRTQLAGHAPDGSGYCPRCDHDDHRCPGCGDPVPHGVAACVSCERDYNLLGGAASVSESTAFSRALRGEAERRGDRDAIDDAYGLDSTRSNVDAIAQMVADNMRGRALRARMVALGLPVVDAEHDVAGFERHVEARALTSLGAYGAVAERMAPKLTTALDDATPGSIVALDWDDTLTLVRLVQHVIKVRRGGKP